MTPPKLSRQEEKIALLGMTGCSDRQVARQLDLSLDTVRTYWKRIRKKMSGQTRAEIFAWLARESLSEEIEQIKKESANLRVEADKRHETLSQLQNCEAVKKALLDHIWDAAVLANLDGAVLEVNALASKALGRPSEEFTGQPLSELFQDDSVDMIHQALQKEGDSLYEGDLDWIRDDGQRRTLLTRIIKNAIPGCLLVLGKQP